MPTEYGAKWLWMLVWLSCTFGCQLKNESQQYNQLEELRVLAIQAEPPDLVPGETTTLSALVFEPNDAAISYEWSWCPARAASSDGFGCTLSEAELAALWSGLGTGIPAPSYDLGTSPTAEFTHVFPMAVVLGICAALAGDSEASDLALFACLQGLEISVSLKVRSGGDEITAIKTLTMLDEGAMADSRNNNPDPTGNMKITLAGRELAAGEQLQPNSIYEITAEFDRGMQCDSEVSVADDCIAESFLPEKREGLDEPTPRRETITMTWFLTMGVTEDEGGSREGTRDNAGNRHSSEYKGGDTTSFVDGGELRKLLENIWTLPFVPEDDQAQLFLVVRDERGGIGWTSYSYSVER